MKTSIYKTQGSTPEDAFRHIWDLLKYTDDYSIRKNTNGTWEMRIEVVVPTKEKREEFEK